MSNEKPAESGASQEQAGSTETKSAGKLRKLSEAYGAVSNPWSLILSQHENTAEGVRVRPVRVERESPKAGTGGGQDANEGNR